MGIQVQPLFVFTVKNYKNPSGTTSHL